MPAMPAAGTALGDKVRRRLESEIVIWLTTVGRDGTPQPNPVWFDWDGESVLTYNRADAARVAHVTSRPRVSLNFDGDGKGGAIMVIVGEAEIDPRAPSASDNPTYAAKYRDHIKRIGQDPAGFASAYPVAIRIRPVGVRGF
ncbi:MAG: TIGR03667 family PPOX class F420-dependent oxidoreductase [Candidatus Dormibacteraeota bacterium]|nr:TIGR03667 family PPOX class F420-dependent oxidoreductase [Candidatus Dormibacteraeota bacterium]